MALVDGLQRGRVGECGGVDSEWRGGDKNSGDSGGESTSATLQSLVK